jgi:rRNA maturation protein Rpf1
METEATISEKDLTSGRVYYVYAFRKTSQFDQKVQEIRCRITSCHRGHMVVESLKRYNKKYAGAEVVKKGEYKGMPLRRVNKGQVIVIKLEERGKPGRIIQWETVRRREGTSRTHGKGRGGR